jgi:hypothetical protein
MGDTSSNGREFGKEGGVKQTFTLFNETGVCVLFNVNNSNPVSSFFSAALTTKHILLVLFHIQIPTKVDLSYG